MERLHWYQLLCRLWFRIHNQKRVVIHCQYFSHCPFLHSDRPANHLWHRNFPDKPHDVPLSLSHINQVTHQPGFEQEFAQQSSDTSQPFPASRIPKLKPDAVASVRTKFPSQCASLVKSTLLGSQCKLHDVIVKNQHPTIHFHRVVDQFAASTVWRYLSIWQQFYKPSTASSGWWGVKFC